MQIALLIHNPCTAFCDPILSRTVQEEAHADLTGPHDLAPILAAKN